MKFWKEGASDREINFWESFLETWFWDNAFERMILKRNIGGFAVMLLEDALGC